MVTYVKNPKLAVDQVLPLYEANGWTNYTANPERLMAGLAETYYVLVAFEGDQLVGLLRAVGDGHTIMFIQDILVLPDHQRQGIGASLLKQTLEDFKSVYQIHLLTDNTEKTKGFYTNQGFTELSELGCLGYTYLQ